MTSLFTALDWVVFAAYFAILGTAGWLMSRVRVATSRDYFLGGNRLPMAVVAISVLATSQSAATFLGGPEQGYRSDLTYLSTNFAAVIAALFVALVLIPRFYQLRVTTVYELLQTRFGPSAKQQAGGMYLVGRVFASGARLYMAAIAVSMILFSGIGAGEVLGSIALLAAIGLAYSFMGGIRSVVYTDALQCLVYIGAAAVVIGFLLTSIPAEPAAILAALGETDADGHSKLTLFDFRLEFGQAGVFTVWSTLTGLVLLNIASFGMDQDMTQRVLSCRDAREGAKAMLLSTLIGFPVVLLFMTIGLLLFVFYQRPDLMSLGAAGGVQQEFAGQEITIFMYYVLHEMPAGVRGLVTVGVIAAALSTLNSGLNSMSSVAVEDFYKPWLRRRGRTRPERHFVAAGRLGMVAAALALGGMAGLCYYWQQYTDMPLLAFALSVMVFSYSGLLGVYFTALFSRRGNGQSVALALAAGFLTTVAMQPYVQELVSGGRWRFDLAFSYQLCIGAAVSFILCWAGRPVDHGGTDS